MKVREITSLLACPDCDLLIRRPEVHSSQTARCPRCGAKLISARHNSVERTLALALTGLILIIPANIFPILSMRILGLEQDETIFASALSMFNNDLYIPALAIVLFTMGVPTVKLLLLTYVTAALQWRWKLPGLHYAMRAYGHMDEWGMLEVYMIAVLVAVVKLLDIAAVTPGLGLYSLAALILVTTFSSSLMDNDLYWELIRKHDDHD